MRKRLLFSLLASSLLLAALPGVAAADGHVEVLEDVATVVVVKDPATTPDFPLASLSRADCPVLVRVVAEDGSSEEFMSCTLSDEPVMIPENQGTAPDATIVDAGGECIWSSDYHFTVDESDVSASAFEVTITPSGRVSAWSSYPAEPLDCPEEE